MQNWQKERNYRKLVKEDGSAAYLIRVDGMDVDVSEEIYLAYSQGDRKDRYQQEQDAGRLLSLERLEEDGALLACLVDGPARSAEEDVLGRMDREELLEALDGLPSDDRDLVDALYFQGMTEREYAARIGMSQKGVNKRKQRALKKIMYNF